MKGFIHRQSPARIISLGFALVIFIGSILLIMPFSVNDNVDLHYIDALYTSTSAVCVTGLVSVDAGDTFTPVGQFILAMLIQIGGLGVTAVGAGIIIIMGRRVDIKGRNLIREAMNLDSGKGVIRFVKSVFQTTLIFELSGAALSFIVFSKDYPPLKALGISLFHSVAAFNNSGFDILGNFQSLTAYRDNILLNLVTCVMIFFGGIGFLVIREMRSHGFHWKKYSMHAKIVLSVSVFLVVFGTILLKLTEDVTWLGALFQSVSARTAGFATYQLGTFSFAGLMVMIVLMFIGASPGSTGGGIKTSTFFVLFKLTVVIVSTYLLLVMEPDIGLADALFEIVSAFGTVGLSTGITPQLGFGAKILSILVMYIGRLGPLTVASLWYFSRGERISYPEGNIAIG